MGGGEASLPSVPQSLFDPESGTWVKPQKPVGSVLSPLPSSTNQITSLLTTKNFLAETTAKQCEAYANVIVQLSASRERVMREMGAVAESTPHPTVKAAYVTAMETAHQNFEPALTVQHNMLSTFHHQYIVTLQEIADYEATIAFMNNFEFEKIPASHDNNNNNNNNINDNIDDNTNSNSITEGGQGSASHNNSSTSGKPPVSQWLQQLMPFWAEINTSLSQPLHFSSYHRAGQGFNFEGWDETERKEMIEVIGSAHRQAEEELEQICVKHPDWDESYPKIFIDFPAFLANTSGCGTAFGEGRWKFVHNLHQQIISSEFITCLQTMSDPIMQSIKAIVITAKRGPLKGNKTIEAQYYDGELIVLWNDLDNISPTSISCEEFKNCVF